uniref:Thioredoxin like 4A n=1 Tax=Nothobranchius furzeri TaxID=105023 RepID=A0A8C6PHH4_NOTFU
MSYMLPHLHNGWQVDQAILSEEDRVLVIRFGHDWDPTCMKMDEVLYSIAEKVKDTLGAELRCWGDKMEGIWTGCLTEEDQVVLLLLPGAESVGI